MAVRCEKHLSESKYEPGTYFLGNETWKVGPRYKLEKYLGSGSFSSVCLALDTETGQKVALKRIANVVSNLENARTVLREVCILRRLSHPHIIKLHNAFWKPCSTGRFTLVNGKLESSSIDVYLALEYCDEGDLHHLRGQLTEAEIQSLMHQLLAGVAYMHRLNVWHRDLKSANVLLSIYEGQLVAKVADLGSARSGAGNTCMRQLKRTESMISEPAGVSMTLAKLLKEHAYQSRFLTMKVCTPCYRAPEVVIARGKYSSAMDMWSVGCIFGELLQRMERAGASITPNLAIMPVFQFSNWSPPTPGPGATIQEPGVLAGQELQAIFEVIGTPEWGCIEDVDSEGWRRFLWQMPSAAPQLMRRFGFAGEPAVDLLRRLLSFDPSRRCRAEEALSHEYFAETTNPATSTDAAGAAVTLAMEKHPSLAVGDPLGAAAAAASAKVAPTAALSDAPVASEKAAEEGQDTFNMKALQQRTWSPTRQAGLPRALGGSASWEVAEPDRMQGHAASVIPIPRVRSAGPASPGRSHPGLRLEESAGGLAGGGGAVWPAAASQPAIGHVAGLLDCGKRRRSTLQSMESHDKAGDVTMKDASGYRSSEAGTIGAGEECGHEVKAIRRQTMHYYDIVEPAAALEYLELELDRLIEQGLAAHGEQAGAAVAVTAVCTLIKQECEAEAERQAELAQVRARGEGERMDSADGSPPEDTPFQKRWWGRHKPFQPDPRNLVANTLTAAEDTATGSSLRRLSISDSAGTPKGPVQVSGSPRYTVDAGGKRLPFGVEDQLKPGRHTEWSPHSGHAFTTQEGPAWGGGLGNLDLDDATKEVISNQQKR